jgi:chloramphenicol 3-O phosphotransferase
VASRILILNGAGSVGKSSIARAFQTISAEPFLHVAMDSFLDMLPTALMDSTDGLIFEAINDGKGPQIAIRAGPAINRTLRGMRRAILALALEGNNLIVDEVMLGSEMDDYKTLLADFDVSFIAVHAPLSILEERERWRGDRMIGLARWQYERVHAGKTYDLEIDASAATPEACARRIKDVFHL